jgi:hypothetical protein
MMEPTGRNLLPVAFSNSRVSESVESRGSSAEPVPLQIFKFEKNLNFSGFGEAFSLPKACHLIKFPFFH